MCRVIGITGGVGCGKTTILTVLKEQYHAGIIEMDAVGKRLMEPGTDCYRQICKVFSDVEGLLYPDKTLNRGILAQVVFDNSERLLQLNGIIHPAVKAYVTEQIAAMKAHRTTYDCLVLESAILLEAGYEPLCDEIWFVQADKEIRIQRLMASRNYTREKCEAVMANQSDFSALSDCNKKIRQLFNNGAIEETIRQIESFMEEG